MAYTPAQLSSLTQIKETANTVFLKVDDGIYEVKADRSGSFSGRIYVSTNEVIDELNRELKVVVLGINQLGCQYVKHSNF